MNALHRTLRRLILMLLILVPAPPALHASDPEPQAYESVRPIEDGRVKQDYLYGEGGRVLYRGHKGLDFPAPLGTTARAVASGTLVAFRMIYADGSPADGGFGNYVMLRHDARQYVRQNNGRGVGEYGYVYSIYAHLRCCQLMPGLGIGSRVGAGQPLAEVDSTGNSTGHHLHLQIVVDPSPHRTDGANYAWTEASSRNPELWLQPFDDGVTRTAAAAGHIRIDGDPAMDRYIVGLQKPAAATNQSYGWSEAYNGDAENPDDYLVENWATTDVAPGTYHLTVRDHPEGGRLLEDLGTHTFVAGETTYVGLYPAYLPDIRSDTGPAGWSAALSIQNRSGVASAITTSLIRYDIDATQSEHTLKPHGSTRLLPPDTGETNYTAGALVSTTQESAAVVELTSADNQENAIYSAILPQRAGAATSGWERAAPRLYLPVVKRGYYGRSSAIRIMNPGPRPAEVTIDFYDDRSRGRRIGPYLLGAHDTHLVEVASSGGGGGGGCPSAGTLCSAAVRSRGGAPLAVVVEERDDGSQRVATAYNAPNGGATRLIFPLVKHHWYQMRTDLQIMNVGSMPTSLTVRFFRSDGSHVSGCDWVAAALPLSAVTLYNHSCLGPNFLGSAVVSSSQGQPLVGQGHEVSLNGRYKKAYSAVLDGAWHLSAPVLYRAHERDGYVWDSAIVIRNLDEREGVSVSARFHTAWGGEAGRQSVWIPPQGLEVLWPPTPFHGTATLEATGPVTALVNVTSNAPQGDSHAIYNVSQR